MDFKLLSKLKKIEIIQISYAFIAISQLFLLFLSILNISLFVRSLLFIVPLIICCITCIILKNNFSRIRSFSMDEFQLNENKSRFLVLTYLLLLIWSIISLICDVQRPLLFIVILILMGLSIFVQILVSSNLNKYLFFSQLFILHILLTYSLTLKYYFYFGAGDILAHFKWIEIIEILGHTTNGFGYHTYQFFPLYHIFLAMGDLIIGSSSILLNHRIFLICGFLMPITDLCVYGIVYTISRDPKISAIASLLFVFNREIIFYSSYMVTRSFAFIILMLIIYLLFLKIKHREYLCLLFTLVLNLSHQTTLLYATFILLVLHVFFSYYSRHSLKNYIILFIASYISYWFFIATNFSTYVMSKIVEHENVITSSKISYITGGITNKYPASVVFLLDRIDYAIMVLLICFVLFFFLSKYKYHVKENFEFLVIPSFIFTVFYFPTFVLLFSQLNNIFLIYRLPLLVSIFIVFLVTLGLVVFMKLLGNRPKMILIIAIFLLLSTFSILNDKNGQDINYIRELNGLNNNYFNYVDTCAFYFLQQNINSNKDITYTDWESSLFFNNFLYMNSSMLPIDFFNANSSVNYNQTYIHLNTYKLTSTSITLLEDEMGFSEVTTKYRTNLSRYDLFRTNKNLSNKSIIYSNGYADIVTDTRKRSQIL